MRQAKAWGKSAGKAVFVGRIFAFFYRACYTMRRFVSFAVPWACGGQRKNREEIVCDAEFF
jgi:hypothetical protein